MIFMTKLALERSIYGIRPAYKTLIKSYIGSSVPKGQFLYNFKNGSI